MKALETSYNGYRFRSRLEARWAVFFDAMQWSYAYEHEGFVLADGTRYLPDFWLSALQTWVEIKPVEPSQDERAKAYDFAIAGVSYYVFFGPPWAFGCFWVDEIQEWQFEEAYFARCRRCASGIYVADDAQGSGFLFVPCESQCSCERYPVRAADIEQAALKAKGARFEHGESGSPRGMPLPPHRRPPAPSMSLLSPEYVLLVLLCHQEHLLKQVQHQLSPEDFHDVDLRAIYAALIARVSDGTGPTFRGFFDASPTPRQSQLLTQIAMEPTLTNPTEISATVCDCVTRIRARQPRAMRQQILEQLRTVSDGSVEQQRLLQEYNRLSKEDSAGV